MGVYTFLRRDSNGKYTWVNERNEYLFASDKGNWLVGILKLIDIKIFKIEINFRNFLARPNYLIKFCRSEKITLKEEVGYRTTHVVNIVLQIVHKAGNIGMIQKEIGRQTRLCLYHVQVDNFQI